MLGDPLQTQSDQYPESISHLKYQFYLYFRSFRTSSGQQHTFSQALESKQPETTSNKAASQESSGGPAGRANDSLNHNPFKPADEVRVNSFKDGLQYMSENCGTVDSPKAEQIDCSICTYCLKYRQNQPESLPLAQR